MKLSIITVNLNNGAGFKKTAESIISQTYQDFEWIVIDGGSTDGSKELIEQYSDHIAYWVSEKDSGIYNAMNKGVRHANGEYLQFLNSGDWLSSSSILERVFMHDFSEDIIYCNISLYMNSVFNRIQKYPKVIGIDFFLNSALGHNSCFVKSQLLRQHPFDESLRIVSDWKFFLQSAIDGVSFKYYDNCVGCFDMSGISSTMPDLVGEERQGVIDSLLPVIYDYKMRQTSIVSSYLSNVYLDEFIVMCSKNFFIRKVITAMVVLMKHRCAKEV